MPIHYFLPGLDGSAVVTEHSALHSVLLREGAVDDLMCQLMSDGEVLAADISGTEKEPLFNEDCPVIQFVEDLCLIRIIDGDPHFAGCSFAEYRTVFRQVLVVDGISKE